ncbi:polymer-forming cytoskeletal protein [Candidatus Berkelbacteria bacterium]|nr:polymer-forming cytoskeletal protein [Candidatus Berkelbacteria bacterium]
MALFEKEKEVRASGPGTVVGANVKLTGILKDTQDITVHGAVEGEVISEHNVVVTETAEIKGPITGQNVTVAGRVNGAITAGDKLEILPSGRVYGSITMADLMIRSGALFIGKSTMPDQTGSPSKKAALPSKSAAESGSPDKPKAGSNGPPREPALTYEVEE